MFEVPPTHWLALLQQPLLHAWLAVQVLVHWCVFASQAWPIGQSVATVQPHVMFDWQMWPVDDAVQSAHTPIAVPHALAPAPG